MKGSLGVRARKDSNCSRRVGMWKSSKIRMKKIKKLFKIRFLLV
jgi:hypothetical protein